VFILFCWENHSLKETSPEPHTRPTSSGSFGRTSAWSAGVMSGKLPRFRRLFVPASRHSWCFRTIIAMGALELHFVNFAHVTCYCLPSRGPHWRSLDFNSAQSSLRQWDGKYANDSFDPLSLKLLKWLNLSSWDCIATSHWPLMLWGVRVVIINGAVV